MFGLIIILCGVHILIEHQSAQQQQPPESFFYSGGQKILVEPLPNLLPVRLPKGEESLDKLKWEDRSNEKRGFDDLDAFTAQRIVFIPVTDPDERNELSRRINELPESEGVKVMGFAIRSQKTGSLLVLTGKVTARFREEIDVQEITEIAKSANLTDIKLNPALSGRAVMRVVDPKTAQDILNSANRLFESKLAHYAEPDRIVELDERDVTPNDPNFSDQWHLKNTGQHSSSVAGADIKATKAWDHASGQGVKIAVFDDAVEIDHQDLSPNYGPDQGLDVIDDDADPSPVFEHDDHGTKVAGLVAASFDNHIGVCGVSPNCSLFVARMSEANDASKADAFFWAIEKECQVINCSWGQKLADTSDDLQAAIGAAVDNGIVVVFAVPNKNVEFCTVEPDISSLPGIIAVAASHNVDQRFPYYAHGSCLSVLAPGSGPLSRPVSVTGLASTAVGDSYTSATGTLPNNSFAGTSAAAAVVSGICGLVLEINPDLSPSEVKSLIENGADKIESAVAGYNGDGFSNTHGFGRVNALKTVAPSVELSVSRARVRVGETFIVTVRAGAPRGLQELSWRGDETGIAALDGGHVYLVPDSTKVKHITWRVRINVPGEYRLLADATDTQFSLAAATEDMHRASTASGEAKAMIIVEPLP